MEPLSPQKDQELQEMKNKFKVKEQKLQDELMALHHTNKALEAKVNCLSTQVQKDKTQLLKHNQYKSQVIKLQDQLAL